MTIVLAVAQHLRHHLPYSGLFLALPRELLRVPVVPRPIPAPLRKVWWLPRELSDRALQL